MKEAKPCDAAAVMGITPEVNNLRQAIVQLAVAQPSGNGVTGIVPSPSYYTSSADSQFT